MEDGDDVVSFEDAVREGEKRVLFTGPRRSGKSSIERVIFHKMPPHETLFLESTHEVNIHYIANNDFVKFQTWDFGGDMNLAHGVRYQQRVISSETFLRGCSSLVYVLDAQEEDYQDSLPKLVETIISCYRINPAIHFEVFLHKVDDLMAEDMKVDRQQSIQNYVSGELFDQTSEEACVSGDILVSYYLTSIYDHSVLEAFSKVVQKLVLQLPVLNSLLDRLIESCAVEKSYLLDVFTKMYIATDSVPVDSHTYELCADLVDVVIDVSCIYGLPPHDSAAVPYDSESSSAIRLKNGMVYYLREVSRFLALVCVLREEYFLKRSLLDYNINCLRSSLASVLSTASS